jgi:hypothetical protein
LALDLLVAQGGVRPSYNEGVTFGYRIEDGLPDALLRAAGATRSRGGWSWPTRAARGRSCAGG